MSSLSEIPVKKELFIVIAVLVLFFQNNTKTEQGEVRCPDNPPSLQLTREQTGELDIVDQKIREHTVKPKTLSEEGEEKGIRIYIAIRKLILDEHMSSARTLANWQEKTTHKESR